MMRKGYFFLQYKKECVNRYYSGCGIKRTSPKIREYLHVLNNRNIEIPFFDLNVNNVCTLKCKNCDQGMPYFHNKVIFSADEIIRNMELLLQKVDYIYQIGILGGEPFLNKDIDRVIQFCAASDKIGSIIVVTNGTIFPREEVLHTLRNDKIIVGVSWYPIENDSNRKLLLEYFQRHNIHFHIRKDDWIDFGDFRYCRKYKRKRLKDIFKKCFLNKCVQYNNGILYRCTKTHLLEDQQIEYAGNGEKIIVKDVASKKEMRRALRKFYSLEYLKACNYCNADDELVTIPLGEQLK